MLAVYSTAIQELGRFGMYVAYVRLQKTIATMRGISSHSLDFAASPAHAFMERVACATAIGVGTGATHALLITGRQLSDASSPGSSYVPGCAMSQYGLGALVALAFALLHVVWTIYAFVDAYPRQSKAGVGLVAGARAAERPARAAVAPGGRVAGTPGGQRHPCRRRALQALTVASARTPPRNVPPAGSHLAASGITLLHAVDGRPALQCGGLTLPLLYVVLIALCAATARSALSTLRKQGRAGGIS